MARLRHLAAIVAVAALPAGVGVAGAATGAPAAPATSDAPAQEHPCPFADAGAPSSVAPDDGV